MLDMVIVAVVVAGAVLYLAWTFRPKRSKRTLPACAGCAQESAHKPPAPVRTRWTG